MLAFFDPAGTQVDLGTQSDFSSYWLATVSTATYGSHNAPKHLAISHHSSLTLKRAKLLFAILNSVPFCPCKHIIQTIMETLLDNQIVLPYGSLVTRSCQRCVSNIPSHELEDKPEGAFGKKR
jgi:hypothetical protein